MSLRHLDGTPSGTWLPRQTMWWPYWKTADAARVESVIGDLHRMGQSGVVLMGMEWGNDYALPDAVAEYLTLFREANIIPLLGLWVGPLSAAEAATAQRAWSAGAGQWGGIVLDAEAGWKKSYRDDPVAATARFHAFMDAVRPLTETLGYAPYSVPSFHRTYAYDLWNSECDFAMPQIYFTGDDDPDFLLDRAFKSWLSESATWSAPLKPIVPLCNAYGLGADPLARQAYGERVLSEIGCISWWRYDIANPAVRAVMADL